MVDLLIVQWSSRQCSQYYINFFMSFQNILQGLLLQYRNNNFNQSNNQRQLPLNLQINGNLVQPLLSMGRNHFPQTTILLPKNLHHLYYSSSNILTPILIFPNKKKELFHSVILILSYHLMKTSPLQDNIKIKEQDYQQ